jgi:hypothetical protein
MTSCRECGIELTEVRGPDGHSLTVSGVSQQDGTFLCKTCYLSIREGI